MFLQKIQTMKCSCSFFLLYLGLKGDADICRLKRGFYHKTSDWGFSDGEWMYISVPTMICPELAPPGKQIVSVVVSVNEDVYHGITNWHAFKEHMTDHTINQLEKYVPRLKEYIEVKEAATPKTLERYTSNTNGAAYGWEVTVNQMWNNRPPHETTIENLYLAGHWTRPGPGIAAVVSSGWSAANLIMKNWRLIL